MMDEFPVDDATLLALEHAMGGCLTYDRPDGVPEDDRGPWRIGADYSMHALLDFLGGTVGRDPNEELIREGRDESDLPEWERGRDWSSAPIVYDTRPHYTEHSVIAALIAEVRRLRTTQGENHAH